MSINKQNYIDFYKFVDEEFISEDGLNMEIIQITEYLKDRKQKIENEMLKIEDSFSKEQIELFIENSSYLKDLKQFIIDVYCEEDADNIFQIRNDLTENPMKVNSIQCYLMMMGSFKNYIWKQFEQEDSEIKGMYELMYGI